MRQVEAILDGYADLRVALRAGDYAALDAIAERIAGAMDAMDAIPAPDTLHLLAREADSAAALLEAAGRGFTAARRRITEIETIRQGLATYAGDGRRQVIAPPVATPRRV